ncbi:YraN family protein [Ruminococcus sp.]|uniref:YraN family protein n=1 Tax=Ruminococcus sp. TaxID=41978 RepID=UPI00386994D2
MIGSNQQFGALGEKLAAKYLKEQGYKILKMNYKNKLGEIDIIASDKKEIVFVEVKTRSVSPYLSGQYAVDKRKQFHIMRTASYYLDVTKCDLQPRFDIIEVEVERTTGQMKKINHIKNAFSQTENYARF